MIPIWPFNNCYVALLLVDGCHANVYGRGNPCDLLRKSVRKDRTVVLLAWWRISEFRYRRMLKEC